VQTVACWRCPTYEVSVFISYRTKCNQHVYVSEHHEKVNEALSNLKKRAKEVPVSTSAGNVLTGKRRIVPVNFYGTSSSDTNTKKKKKEDGQPKLSAVGIFVCQLLL
jgi:hypothetical protein